MSASIQDWLFDPTIGRLVTAAAGLLIVVVLTRLVQGAVTRRLDSPEARYRVRKFVTFVSYVAGVLVLAVVYSDRLGGLTVALGVAGAGIAFALQEVIASVAGWLAVSFGGFFKIGDRVQLGGIKGDVIDIGVLRTTVMECGEWMAGDVYTGRVVRIANSFVFKEPVFNYSGDFPFLWDEVKVPVKYGSDVREARALLERIAQEVGGDVAGLAASEWREFVTRFHVADARLEPAVSLVANDNWIEFSVRYVVDYKRRRATKNRLFTRILEEIDATGGRVGLASATYHLVEAPTLRVRLES